MPNVRGHVAQSCHLTDEEPRLTRPLSPVIRARIPISKPCALYIVPRRFKYSRRRENPNRSGQLYYRLYLACLDLAPRPRKTPVSRRLKLSFGMEMFLGVLGPRGMGKRREGLALAWGVGQFRKVDQVCLKVTLLN